MLWGEPGMFLLVFSWWAGMGLPMGGLPMGIPPAPEDPIMARVAPDECLFYATWAGVAEIDPDANPTEAWWGQPEIQKMVSKLLKAHRGRIMKEAKDTGDPLTLAFADLMLQVSEMSTTHPFAIYLEDLNLRANGIAPVGGAILGLGDQTDAFKKSLEKIDTLLEERKASGYYVSLKKTTIDGLPCYQLKFPETRQVLTFGIHEKYLVVGWGRGAFSRLVAHSKTPPPPWLTRIRKELPVKRFSSLSYANVKQLTQLSKTAFTAFQGAMAFMWNPNEAVNAINGMNRIAPGDILEMASVSALDDKGFYCRTLFRTRKELTGLLPLIDNDPIEKEWLETIPDNSYGGVTVRLSATKTLEFISTFAKDIGYGEAWKKQMEQLEQQLGIQFKEDLAEALDDCISLYCVPDDNNFMDGWIASIRIKNEMLFPETFKTFNDHLKDIVEQSESPFEFQHQENDGFDFFSISASDEMAGQMQVAWALADKEIIVGFTPQAIQKHFERSNARQSKTVKPFWEYGKREGVRGPIAMASTNVPMILKTWGPFVQGAGPVDEPLSPDFDFALKDIPGIDVLTKNVGVNRLAVYRTEKGFEVLQRQTYPSSSAGVTTIAMGVLLMPHWADALANADEPGVEADLEKISSAIKQFTYRHDKLPASYSVDKNGKPLLSWRVHLLPLLGRSKLYHQFHLDEPWDSPHNKALIAKMPKVFKHPGMDLPPGMTVYLAVTGEDAMLTPPEQRGRKEQPVIGKRGYEDVPDNSWNTAMLFEVNRESAVPWTRPVDLPNDAPTVMKKIQNVRPNGTVLVAMGEGYQTVRFSRISEETLKAILSLNGGEDVDIPYSFSPWLDWW